MFEQFILPLKLNPQLNFENYISGDNTEIVYRLRNIFVDVHPESAYFFVCGEKSLGKTHLVYATYLQALANNHPAFYLSLKNYSQYQPNIFDLLEQNQLICLDDIDAIAGDKLWEEALFHLYNRIREKKRYLLITASKLNSLIPWMLPDLKSRLNSGLNYQLKSLTDTEKIQALNLHANAKGMHITVKVWDYILTNYSRDMQTLVNILQQLEQQSLIQKKRITIPFVKFVIG